LFDNSAMHRTTLALAYLFAGLIVACNKDSGSGGAAGSASTTSATRSQESVALNGAGATFPYPLYSKWVSEYQSVEPRVKVNYQSIGSGGGIRQITERTVDFGASDAPMTDEQLAKAPGKLVHVPMTLGAVVLTFNLPDVKALKLTPEVASGIFLGEIKKWDDAKIAKLNDGVKLPSSTITVVYRSDGSGTTAVFTDYLSKVSPTWKDKAGSGTSVKFPVGLGAKGNEGVTGQVKTTPGSLGYVELAYARQNGMPAVTLQNKAGKMIEPTLESITAAAASFADKIPDDMRASLTNADGDEAYPITSFSYMLVYEDNKDAAKAEAIAKFLWWGVHDGQKLGPALHFAPLPEAVVKKAEAKLRSLKSGDKVLLAGK
jgi:phosphate transport system substrate-binding protein